MSGVFKRSGAARYLDKPESWLKYAEHRNLIPFVRVGRQIRYRLEDLDIWLQQHAVGAKNGTSSVVTDSAVTEDHGEPSVPVFADRTATSWPKSERGEAAVYTPLSVALTQPFVTDAHFAQYSVPTLARRLGLDAADLLPQPIAVVVLVFDVDCVEAHATNEPASNAWWRKERRKVERLFSDHVAGFAARTRGGYRLVFQLSSPFLVSNRADATSWKRFYFRSACELVRFQVIADPTCAPWVQLFRLPRATRDQRSGPENLETLGDAEAISHWESVGYEEEEDLDIASRVAKEHPSWKRVASLLAPERGDNGSPTIPVYSSGDRYVRVALAKASHVVSTAAPSTRNATLNREAYSLARLVRGGRLRRADLELALTRAAQAAGLGDNEITATLKSALSARLVAR